jgi:TP901 family phage tail tape measure protein
MANDLRLQVIMDLANKASAPLRNISASSADAAKALKAAREQLKQLNTQQAAVDGFTKQQTAYKASSDKLKVLQQNLDVLRQTQGAHSKVVQAAEKALSKQTTEVDKQKTALLGLRARLNELGIGNVSAAQARLKTETAAATAAIEQQSAKLKQLADQQKKLNDLKTQHGKDMMKVGMLAGSGVGMQAAGRQGMQWGLGPIKDFSAHEDAMVGVQRQVAGARDESGRLTATYYKMERQIRELSGQIPVATTEIAKMFTAGARMEVPTDNLQEFVRMASEIAIAFDAVPDDITEAMGKVAKNFKIPITDIRGLADAINYLDDNAISKGDDIIDFMSRVAGTASMVKITAKETAALGSTLLTLGERRETASTAVNAVFSNLGAANTQTKKFRKMVTTLGLSTNQLEAGMQTDALGTIFKVMEAVRKLPKIAKTGGTSQIDAVAELFGKEHWDSFSKLLENRAEFERQIGLANSQQAQGSMGRESAARNQALSAQWQMAKNRAFNLSSAVGETLKPALLELLNTINPMLEKFSQFIQKNPELVGWIMKSVIAVSAIVIALGTLAVSLAAILGPMLLVRFMFARLALGYAAIGGASGLAAAGLLKIQGLLALVVRFGTALYRANPIAAAAFAISAAFYSLYLRWDQLKALFNAGEWMKLGAAIWEGIEYGLNAATMGMYGLVKSVFTGIVDLVTGIFDINSPSKVFAWIGSMLMDGLISGITSRLTSLKDTVVGAASAIGNWFKEKLGGGAALVKSASAGLAAATAIGAPGIAGATPLRIDQRPPLTSAATRPAVTAGSGAHQITINAAPGMDPQAIARAVSAELDRRDRAQGARRRSSLSDIA